MDKIVVKGGRRLAGVVGASGAKNSVLPLLFSTLCGAGRHVFHNVPLLKDVESASLLLEHLGCQVRRTGHTVVVDNKGTALSLSQAPYEIVRKMRASILVLGPLLARFGEAEVSMPGGCAIGGRPIDLHLEGLRALGAHISVTEGYIKAVCKKLVGNVVVFDSPTVGGTENIMMAAALADGTTLIENAAKEPEIADLAEYFNKMGAKVSGAGSSTIRIEGVEQLRGSEHYVIPDRIEVGTLLLAAAITGGEVSVKDCLPSHLDALIFKMKECEIKTSVDNSSITVHKNSFIKPVDLTTAPHPAFPTDLQAQMMACLTQADGTSVITETVFENRFIHVSELIRLGADITAKNRVAVVRGRPGCLMGAPVMASDLRASASLVLAGLAAQGETVVSRIYHLDRGYEKLEEKLSSLGADIVRR